MRWRAVCSWILFYGATAVVAYLAMDNWISRIIGYLFMTIPTTIWVRRKIAISR